MKIVILEPLGTEKAKITQLAEKIKPLGNKVVYYDTKTTDTEELVKRGADADIIIIANMPLKKEVISRCTKLKFISVAFTGVDHLDVDYCKQKGIAVSNAAGYSTNAVAELTFGLAISVLRNIVPCDARTREQSTKDGLVGTELFGKKFGIVGTGAIGLKVAGIAKAFGCELLGYSRTEKKEFQSMGGQYTNLETLLKECDIVSLHTPFNEQTKHLINAEALSLMKPSAILLNVARGGVVDNQALAKALDEGKIAGAGIDVFDMEPPVPKDYSLLYSKNTVLTPHVAFASKEALLARADIVFDNIIQWQKENQINKIC